MQLYPGVLQQHRHICTARAARVLWPRLPAYEPARLSTVSGPQNGAEQCCQHVEAHPATLAGSASVSSDAANGASRSGAGRVRSTIATTALAREAWRDSACIWRLLPAVRCERRRHHRRSACRRTCWAYTMILKSSCYGTEKCVDPRTFLAAHLPREVSAVNEYFHYLLVRRCHPTFVYDYCELHCC